MTTWVIEENVFNEECFGQMISHFIEKEISFRRMKIIPFIHELDGALKPIEDGPVVVYGSIGSQKLAIKKGWNPGVWTSGNFNEATVLTNIGTMYLNADLLICPISQVMDRCRMETFFIKPNADTKEFAGEVTTRTKFPRWYQQMIDIGYLENNDFEVVISSVKSVYTEYRLIVVDGKVSSASMYRDYGVTRQKKVDTKEFQPFINTLEQRFVPAPVYAVDVTHDEFDSLKVIEYNTFNSAGLYKCDVGAIIDDINRYIDEQD